MESLREIFRRIHVKSIKTGPVTWEVGDPILNHPPEAGKAIKNKLEILEERISSYYLSISEYTSYKVYITPSLYERLSLVDRHDLFMSCKNSKQIHLIHPQLGLGILPYKSFEDFYQMAEYVAHYEAKKVLCADWGSEKQYESVQKWIEIKVDESHFIASDGARQLAMEGKASSFSNSFPINEKDKISLQQIVWALVRFTFHVGNLYRCNLKGILVLCDNNAHKTWLTLTNKAIGSGRLQRCDEFPVYPHYEYMLLPPLDVHLSPPNGETIIEYIQKYIEKDK